jgi:predicted flap endonuclease-1-like 5' DNA nuclease
MGYVLLEIIIPLILAAVLGLLVGWLLWRWRRTKVSWTEWETTRTSLTESQQRLGLLESEARDLRGQAETAESARLGLVAAVDSHEKALVQLRGEIGERDERLRTLGAELDGSRRRVAALGAELDSATARGRELELSLEDATARIADLAADLDAANGRAASLQDEIVATTTRADALRVELEERDSRLGRLEIDLREREAAVSELAGLRQELVSREQRIADLEVETAGLALLTNLDIHPHGEGSHVPLLDRSAPEGYTIKGNRDSMLYHRPDSRSYGATIAEVWFDTPSRAERAGFKLANTHPGTSSRGTGENDTPPLPHGLVGTAGIVALAGGAELHPYGAGSHGRLADNSTPDGYTIKGNVDSMLYHRPDSRNYGATIAEVWFDTEQRALSAGFSPAPTHPNSAPEIAVVPAAPAAPLLLSAADDLDAAKADGAEDNLQLIDGVGPKLEKFLHDRGIRTFAALAALDDAGIDALQDGLAEFPGRIRREEWVPQAARLARGEGVAVPAPADRDDLQRIKGVGPVLERWLHGRGIFRFGQLADLDDAAVDRLDDALEDFPGRIHREEWIAQARTLAAE